MLCLEHLPGSSWEHSSATSPSLPWSLHQWGLDSSHSEVSFLPVPRSPGLGTLLDASLVFTFLLPLFLCRPHPPPSAFGYILKRLGEVHCRAAPGSRLGKHWPLAGGDGRAFNLFLFLLRFSPSPL